MQSVCLRSNEGAAQGVAPEWPPNGPRLIRGVGDITELGEAGPTIEGIMRFRRNGRFGVMDVLGNELVSDFDDHGM